MSGERRKGLGEGGRRGRGSDDEDMKRQDRQSCPFAVQNTVCLLPLGHARDEVPIKQQIFGLKMGL